MFQHKFAIGQEVHYLPRPQDVKVPRGRYRIVRQLPPEDGELQYRVKHAVDGHERAVSERQLLAVRADEAQPAT